MGTILTYFLFDFSLESIWKWKNLINVNNSVVRMCECFIYVLCWTSALCARLHFPFNARSVGAAIIQWIICWICQIYIKSFRPRKAYIYIYIYRDVNSVSLFADCSFLPFQWDIHPSCTSARAKAGWVYKAYWKGAEQVQMDEHTWDHDIQK